MAELELLATSGSRCSNPSRSHNTHNTHHTHNTPDTSNHSCDHSRDGHVRAHGLYDVPGLVLYDVLGLGLVLYDVPGRVLCHGLQPLR